VVGRTLLAMIASVSSALVGAVQLAKSLRRRDMDLRTSLKVLIEN